MSRSVQHPLQPPDPRDLRLEPVVDDERWGDGEALSQLLASVAAQIVRTAETGVPVGSSATVVFSNDTQVRSLNAQFRKIDKPTNVLSFPASSGSVDEDGRPYLGDVVLAYETLQREAGEQGIDPMHHVLHLVVHGLLHLGGHDHDDDAEAEVMEALETTILARLGVADPYAC